MPDASSTPSFFLVGPAFSDEKVLNLFSVPSPGIKAAGKVAETSEDLEATLQTGLAGHLRTGAMRDWKEFDDTLYYLPKRAEVDLIVDYLRAGLQVGKYAPAYLKQIFDCEDYAYLTKILFALHRLYNRPADTFTALAAGLMWAENFPQAGNRHAANVIVTADEGILFVDPTPGANLPIIPLTETAPGFLIHHLVI